MISNSTHVSNSKRTESSASAVNLCIRVRISERSCLHCHPLHNAIDCIHGNNTVYYLNMSSVHVRTSSQWDIRDATTPSPIPVRITPFIYLNYSRAAKE